jgi:hypothetical protein
MLLIVETGESLPEANSYIELTDVEKYLSSNIMKKFDELSEEEQIDRIITASLFIDYSFNWIGKRKTIEQGLNWPRLKVTFQGHSVPDNYIPVQIKKATAMAINLVIEYGITFFQETGEAQVKKEKLGPLETEYFETSKNYMDINNMLRGFHIKSGGSLTAKVVRV